MNDPITDPIADPMGLLTAARPARLDPPAADARTAVDAIVTHHRPRRSRRPMLVAAAVVAVAGLTAAAVILVPETSVPGTSVPGGEAPPQVLSADRILLAAAERTSATPSGTGRFVVRHDESGFVLQIKGRTGTYAMLERSTSEMWLSRSGADPHWTAGRREGLTPLTPADEAAWRADGAPTEVQVMKPVPKGNGPTSPVGIGPGERSGNAFEGEVYALGADNVTIADLESLPTTPDALRDDLMSRFDGGGGDLPTDRDEWLLTVGSHLVVGMPVPADVRAAAYRMLSGVPGVRALGEVRDRRGRTGQAVAFHRTSAYAGTLEERLILDPATGAGLASEIRTVEPGGTTKWLEPGVLVSYQLVVSTENTDDEPPTTR